MHRIEIVEADITKLALDAIVNAANDRLLRGGGVCGAIHRAAGHDLEAACRAIGSCPTGEARLTPGFGLAARFVIHAVGPVWVDGRDGEDALLAGAYRSSLRLAVEKGLHTIAFPALSTGVYDFPPDRAAPIAVGTVARFLESDRSLARVVFACFDPASVERHRQALSRLVNR